MAGSIPVTSPITATGNTGPLQADSDVAPLVITVTASAVTGTTPSATFIAERCTPGTDTGGITWDDADQVSASALTAAGTKVITLPPKADTGGQAAGWWRLKWTVTGTTPSFTISVATAAG